MRHVPVIRGLNLQGKTCAEALGDWVCRGFYFVLKWGFQNKIIFVNVLERLSNKRAKKKHLPQGHFPKTGTLHARSGARTLDTLIKRGRERKINEETGLTGIDRRNKILMLSRPIWQQKGGAKSWKS